MSQAWKLIPAGVIAALIWISFAPGGAIRPTPVHAADCTRDHTGTLVIKIIDVATGNPVAVEGVEVLVKPNPKDFELDEVFTDTSIPDANASLDRDAAPGVIQLENACSTQGSETYKATLWQLPEILKDCKVMTASDTGSLAARRHTTAAHRGRLHRRLDRSHRHARADRHAGSPGHRSHDGLPLDSALQRYQRPHHLRARCRRQPGANRYARPGRHEPRYDQPRLRSHHRRQRGRVPLPHRACRHRRRRNGHGRSPVPPPASPT